MKLTVLIDSVDYAFRTEIYQHQLHSVLSREHDCQYVTIQDMSAGVRPLNDNVYVATRLRETVKYASSINTWLDNRACIIQDYDPWIFFDDSSKHKGGYFTLLEQIKSIRAFCVPNKSWADIIRHKTSVPTMHFKLGVLPQNCDDTLWEPRTRRLEFKGSTYPVRERTFSKLNSYIPIVWTKDIIKPYSAFLQYLSTLRVWAQDESEPVIVDGVKVCRNWLWPKAIEVLSRGCFLIRDMQPEAHEYGIDSLPTCFLYDDIEQASALLLKIESMNPNERNDRILETTKMIREQNCYETISNQMTGWFNE